METILPKITELYADSIIIIFVPVILKKGRGGAKNCGNVHIFAGWGFASH